MDAAIALKVVTAIESAGLTVFPTADGLWVVGKYCPKVEFEAPQVKVDTRIDSWRYRKSVEDLMPRATVRLKVIVRGRDLAGAVAAAVEVLQSGGELAYISSV